MPGGMAALSIVPPAPAAGTGPCDGDRGVADAVAAAAAAAAPEEARGRSGAEAFFSRER